MYARSSTGLHNTWHSGGASHRFCCPSAVCPLSSVELCEAHVCTAKSPASLQHLLVLDALWMWPHSVWSNTIAEDILQAPCPACDQGSYASTYPALLARGFCLIIGKALPHASEREIYELTCGLSTSEVLWHPILVSAAWAVAKGKDKQTNNQQWKEAIRLGLGKYTGESGFLHIASSATWIMLFLLFSIFSYLWSIITYFWDTLLHRHSRTRKAFRCALGCVMG